VTAVEAILQPLIEHHVAGPALIKILSRLLPPIAQQRMMMRHSPRMRLDETGVVIDA